MNGRVSHDRPSGALRLLAMVAVFALPWLTACGDKDQSKSVRKGDAPASQGAAAAYAAPGWKAGDATGWEKQIKARTQAQNEYTRTGAR